LYLTLLEHRIDDLEMKKQAPKAPKAPNSKESLRKDVLRVVTHVRAGGAGGDEDGRGDG
jgi:hypothetical protein